jgi:hypothetical protein
VIDVCGQSSSSLFACDPKRLMGKHVCDFLDIMMPGELLGA